MKSVGMQPHHYNAPSYRFDTREKPNKAGLPEEEAKALARQADMTLGPVPITNTPMPTIEPRPGRLGNGGRTNAAGYDPVLQRLRIEWGDGGPAYNYYNVPPQIWDSFQDAPSPGRYINAVLNYFSYGQAEA